MHVGIVMLHVEAEFFQRCVAEHLNVSQSKVFLAQSWPSTIHFMEIDHEIIFTVILLPSAESFKKGCCQLQAKVCTRSTS